MIVKYDNSIYSQYNSSTVPCVHLTVSNSVTAVHKLLVTYLIPTVCRLNYLTAFFIII